jgi:hypothetical protein
MSPIMCIAVAMNIVSLPAGNTVVGTTALGEQVQLQDGSLFRDWVFISDPRPQGGPLSRGWVPYANLACNQ